MKAATLPMRPLAASAENLRRAKDASKLAFAAYEQAVREGDTATAEAARARFLNASAALSALGKGTPCHA